MNPVAAKPLRAWVSGPCTVESGGRRRAETAAICREADLEIAHLAPASDVLALARVDQVLLSSCTPIIGGDYFGVESLGQRHLMRVVAGEGGLQFGGDPLPPFLGRLRGGLSQGR